MSRRAPTPISREALIAGLRDRILELRGPVVVCVDGAPATGPEVVAAELTTALRTAGRRTVHVEDRYFWRDASVRLEYGREDVDAYSGWVDGEALRREVIAPLRGGRPVLPSLRDPLTNRSTRASAIDVGDGVVVISGALLLSLDLDADLVVHLAMSPAALQRHMPALLAWTAPAFARYERDFQPQSRSDVVLRCDDPRHPAVVGLT